MYHLGHGTDDERRNGAGTVTTTDRERWIRTGLWLLVATMVYNAIEAIIALWAGARAGSIALVGFGFDSVIELAAASVALQNSFGMTCDPVANRVEAPCLGKNTMAAANALSAANMALAGFNHLIPLDEVLVAMDQVGRSLPHALRCTGLGGLSVTETSRAIEERLKQKKPY